MNQGAGPCRWQGPDLHLRLHVQPRARRDEAAGEHGGRIRVRITAPPVEGRANDHLRRLLAAWFGVPRNRVELAAGAGSRDKHFVVHHPRRLPDWCPPPPSP